LAAGVSIGEVAAFAAYEALWVVVPGAALVALLRPRSQLFEIVALGWAAGYAVEVLAFAGTSAIGFRPLFWGLPVLAAVVGVAAARRRQAPPGTQGAAALSSGQRWATSGVCLLALTYLVGGAFLPAALPRDVVEVAYPPDTVFQLAVATEALHHWPITNPQVAGEPLPYHNFAFVHLAAIAQVTGIDLATIRLRLYLVPGVLAIVLLLVLVGKAIAVGRHREKDRAWVGVMAAALVVGAGKST
ncbi:MAG: hypothetical protein WKF96_19775, partial [Solirubrobacteraceae bacterium]